MSQSAAIAKVSHLHEALLNHLIVNPRASGTELALAFNRTPAWISTIINSQIFRAKLAERQDTVFIEAVIDVRGKLEGVANAAVEKLGVCLQNSQDPKYVLDVADKALHRLGYAPSRTPPAPASTTVNQQVNLYGQVDASTIANARAMIGAQARNPQLPDGQAVKELVHDEIETTDRGPTVGQACREPATVCQGESAAEGTASPGDSV